MGFFDQAGGALISGLGALGSGLYNTFVGQKQSKDLMDYQYKLQQEAIDKQNFYNSPQEQMKRLAAAGLSPNLVYGNGVDGNQSSAASPSMANRHSSMGNPLQDVVEQYNQQKALRLQEIQTRSQAFESRERQLKLRAETLGQMLDNTFNDRTMETRVKQLGQDLVNDIQRHSNMVADEALTWSKTRVEDNKLNELWANIDLLKSRKNLTDEQARTEVVRQESLRSGIRVNDATISRIAAEIPYIKAGTDLREQAAKIQGVEFDAGKAGDQWLAEHPKVAVVYSLLCKLLGVGKDVADIVTP